MVLSKEEMDILYATNRVFRKFVDVAIMILGKRILNKEQLENAVRYAYVKLTTKVEGEEG